MIEVVPLFEWPEDVGHASGVIVYAALTNPDITDLFGEWDSFSFGWHD